MRRPTHTYIGRCRGCKVILSSAYDLVDDPKGTSKFVADMIKRSLEVERVPLATVDLGDMTCRCKATAQPSKLTVGLPLFETVGS